MSHKPGGGLHSRVVRHTTAPKVEPKPHARNPARVAQYGALVGNHVTSHGGSRSPYRGEPDFTRQGYTPPVGPTSLSNNGPKGQGRTLYGQSGSQGCHGQPAQGAGGLPSTKGQWPD
jgi:hypothetical protein